MIRPLAHNAKRVDAKFPQISCRAASTIPRLVFAAAFSLVIDRKQGLRIRHCELPGRDQWAVNTAGISRVSRQSHLKPGSRFQQGIAVLPLPGLADFVGRRDTVPSRVPAPETNPRAPARSCDGLHGPDRTCRRPGRWLVLLEHDREDPPIGIGRRPRSRASEGGRRTCCL